MPEMGSPNGLKQVSHVKKNEGKEEQIIKKGMILVKLNQHLTMQIESSKRKRKTNINKEDKFQS